MIPLSVIDAKIAEYQKRGQYWYKSNIQTLEDLKKEAISIQEQKQ
mgnify:FL=1